MAPLTRSAPQSSPERSAAAPDAMEKPPTGVRTGRRTAVLALAIGAAAALGYAAALMRLASTTPALVTSTLSLPTTSQVPLGATQLAISPDGSRVAFSYPNAAGRSVLWVRDLASADAQPLTGTDGASGPFWSPDSRFIAFVAGERLKRIDTTDGSMQTLADNAGGQPGAWSRAGVILYAHHLSGLIYRVPAQGGAPAPATERRDGDDMGTTYYPAFLPDATRFLYLRSRTVYAGSLNDNRRVTVLEDAGNATYASGHLLFVRESTLFAQPFDPDGLRVSGSAVPLATRVRINTGSGAGTFSVSANDTLVYDAEDTAPATLTWLDRQGHDVGTLGDAAMFSGIHLSGDGRWVAAAMRARTEDTHDVWVFDLARDVRRRITSGGDDNTDPIVSSDGGQVLYSSRRGVLKRLLLATVGVAGGPERLVEDLANKYPSDWSADGQHVLWARAAGAGQLDLWTLALQGDRAAVPIVQTVATESRAAFSPDGRWIAYQSDQSGRPEVYVTAFPVTGPGRPVSLLGGANPRWRGDGREIVFLNGTRVMRVAVTPSASGLEVSSAEPLFDLGSRFHGQVMASTGFASNQYAVTPDGQRFLFALPADRLYESVTLVQHWPSALPRH